MTYEQIKSLKSKDFKRLCGVRPETFNQMLEDGLSPSQFKQKTGRPSKLTLENQLLMTLDLSENSKARLFKALGQNFDIFVKTEL